YIADDESMNQYRQTRMVRAGDWVVLISGGNRMMAHCRVNEVLASRLKLGEYVLAKGQDQTPDRTTAKDTADHLSNKHTAATGSALKADCYVYDKNFDDLSKRVQLRVITGL